MRQRDQRTAPFCLFYFIFQRQRPQHQSFLYVVGARLKLGSHTTKQHTIQVSYFSRLRRSDLWWCQIEFWASDPQAWMSGDLCLALFSLVPPDPFRFFFNSKFIWRCWQFLSLNPNESKTKGRKIWDWDSWVQPQSNSTALIQFR